MLTVGPGVACERCQDKGLVDAPDDLNARMVRRYMPDVRVSIVCPACHGSAVHFATLSVMTIPEKSG